MAPFDEGDARHVGRDVMLQGRGGFMDTVDATLVEALLENGRASYAELGRLVGLSGPSVQERVRRLEERGIVTGYRATVDPSALGFGLTALIGLVLSDSAGHGEVGVRLADVAGVEDCWFIAGDEAYMLKVRVRDVEGLERLLGHLVGIEGVARTRTTLVISTRFEGRTIEIHQGAEQPEPPADSA